MADSFLKSCGSFRLNFQNCRKAQLTYHLLQRIVNVNDTFCFREQHDRYPAKQVKTHICYSGWTVYSVSGVLPAPIWSTPKPHNSALSAQRRRAASASCAAAEGSRRRRRS